LNRGHKPRSNGKDLKKGGDDRECFSGGKSTFKAGKMKNRALHETNRLKRVGRQRAFRGEGEEKSIKKMG